MSFIRDRKYYIIASLIFGLIILQIIDFPRYFSTTIIIALLKIAFSITAIILIIVFIRKWYYKLLYVILSLFIIYFSYDIPLWEITANIYIQNKSEEFINIFKIIEKDSAFVILTYDEDKDSLRFDGNYFGNKPPYSESEIKSIRNFMKENKPIELWKDDYGLAFIFERFIDNRNGLLYCPDYNKCKILDKTYFEYKFYRKIRNQWYYYGAG